MISNHRASGVEISAEHQPSALAGRDDVVLTLLIAGEVDRRRAQRARRVAQFSTGATGLLFEPALTR